MAENEVLDSEERLLAALAHLGVLLPVYGIVAPILVWVTRRGRARELLLQAVQATVYQALPFLLSMIFFVAYMILMAFALLITSLETSGPRLGAALFGALPMCLFSLLFFLYFLFIVYGVVGAVLAFQGRKFRYLIIGPWLDGYLAAGERA